MGFGVTTKGAADISEMFYFFRKVSEACIASANSCSFKGETKEPESWQKNSQPLLPWQGWVGWVAGGAQSLETQRIWRM